MHLDRKSIIGISGNMTVEKGDRFPGYKMAYVNNDYVQSVVMAGGIPYILPMIDDENVIKEQISHIDGLILSGGYDPNPLLWGEEPHQKLGDILPKRDVFDHLLYKYAVKLKKPILGICRGVQFINVINGGTLYQDLSLMEGCYIKHNQEHLPNVATHTVEIMKDTKLYNLLGKTVMTNSFHHLAIKDIAKGFKACAVAKDGVVEAIEKDEDYFILGIQWHPEMMAKDCSKMLKIFERFIEEAKNQIEF